MIQKTTLNGIDFEQSTRTSLFVPKQYRFQVDHPILAAAGRAVLPMTATGLAAVLAVLPLAARADTNPDAPPADPSQSLFVGVSQGQNVNTNIDYHRTDGSQATLDVFNSPWINPSAHSAELGVRTPYVLEGLLRGTAAGASDHKRNAWDYFAMMELVLSPQFTLRAGPTGNQDDHTAGFAGARFSNDVLTLDGDLSHDGAKGRANAFGSLFLGDKLYASVGGALTQDQLKQVTAFLGWINQSGLGGYAQNTYTPETDSHSGFAILADRFAMNRGALDFRHSLASGTRAETPFVLAGWAPPDGKLTERLALTGKWNVNDATADAQAKVYFRPNGGNLFVALGGSDREDRATGDHTPTGIADIFALVPGTPFGARVIYTVDLEKGKKGGQAALWYSEQF